MTDKPITPERLRHIKDQYERWGEAALERACGELLAEIDRLRERAENKCVEYRNKWRNAEQDLKRARETAGGWVERFERAQSDLVVAEAKVKRAESDVITANVERDLALAMVDDTDQARRRHCKRKSVMTRSPKAIAAELRALGEKATPGPWKSRPSLHGNQYRSVQIGRDEMYSTLELEPGDANLISAYRNHHATILAALEEVEGLRKALDVFTLSIEAEAREAFCTVEGQSTWPQDWKESDPVGFENWSIARRALGSAK